MRREASGATNAELLLVVVVVSDAGTAVAEPWIIVEFCDWLATGDCVISCACALAAPAIGTTRAEVTTAAVRPNRTMRFLRCIPFTGIVEILSDACEVSCRVRAGAARSPSRLHPEPPDVTGTATYLGPPLLP
jgi:hypothetical protein